MAEQTARIEDGNGNIVVQAVDSTVTIAGAPPPRLTLVPWHRRPRPVKAGSDASLLDPFTQSFTFIGREADLERHTGWLTGGALRPSVRCLTGRAGAGKTRLAIELCRRAEALDGWDAGFATHTELARFFAQQNLGAWGWRRPTLVVIDYAAGAAQLLRKWLAELALNPGQPGVPLRLLLLERTAGREGGWWADLTRVSNSEANLHDLFDPAEPEPLPVLAVEDQAALRQAAAAAADSAAGRHAFGQAAHAPLGEPLDALMAGLVAGHGTDPAGNTSRTQLAAALAEREQRRIERLAGGRGVDAPALWHMAAVLTLQGGADLDGVDVAVEQEQAALGFRSDPLQLCDLLHEVLPAEEGGRLAAIVPDLIGEAFILATLTERRLAATRQAGVVGRCRARAPEATLASLMRLAQDFADSDQHPALRWLDALIAKCESVEELRQIEAAFPHQTLILRERAAEITSALARYLADVPAGEDTEWVRGERARLLSNASVRLSAVGRREEALGAALEAVEIRRELALARPDAFRPDLAGSLNNYANRLSAVGRREEALGAALEAVEVYRELALARPDAFRPDLALSLNNYANILSAVGRREEALGAALEAVEIRRELALARPDAFGADLGRSLAVLANCLEAVGDLSAALERNCESIATLTPSFVRWPEAYASLMSFVCQEYLRRCEAAGAEPDTALLAPIIEVFQRLQPGEDAAEATGEA